MAYWVITDQQEDEQMYWSNADGWTEFGSEADRFSDRQMNVYNLPMGNDPQWVADETVTCFSCLTDYSVFDDVEMTSFSDHGMCFDCAHGW